MENNRAMDVPPPPPKVAAPGSHRNLLIVAVALAAVALTVGSVLAVTMLSAPAGQGLWLFKGAYANYEGSTSMSIMGYSYSFDFSARLEVLDYNSTHACVRTTSSIGSSVGETSTYENATWVPISNFNFVGAFSDTNLTRSYDANVNVGNLGIRNCVVYEYATDGPTMMVYVDKVLQWPVKMSMSMSGEGFTSPMTMDITLTETNIPGLR